MQIQQKFEFEISSLPKVYFVKLVTLIVMLGSLSLCVQAQNYIGSIGIFAANDKTTITVNNVEKGSPADGKIKKGDVIVGAGGKKFELDPRKEIAAIIDYAESKAGNGSLPLTLKNGEQIELKLQILGNYSESSPWECRKTNEIVTRIADQMVESGSYAKGEVAAGWLGLMATGEDKYLDIVKKELPKQEWANPDPEKFKAIVLGEAESGYVGWYWGYSLIALSEYYLLTKDESVMPAIKTYALSLAEGQDPAGIWGHRMATPKRGGRLPGYAHINNPSLSCLIGMLLARECGIDDPLLNKAIDKSVGFYRTYVGEGAIPYGVHDPNTRIFNNNGSSAMAAVVMSLAKDTEGTKFFSRQAAAAYDILETGHATHYFNVLWTPLGASLSGPEVTHEFLERGRYVYTLYRSWDNRFTYNGKGSKGCNDDGSLLLSYCLPRRQLKITGKGGDETLWVKGDEVDDVIGASQIDYASLSNDELISLFGHEAPQVTRRAVWTLREREGEFIPKLVNLIKTGTDIEKRSAIGFFGYKCPPDWALPQVDLIGSVLGNANEQPKVRADAAYALCWHGKPAYKFYDDMLKLVVAEESDDDFALIDKQVGSSLVILAPDPFELGLVKDKELFYNAALALADNPRQEARANGMKLLRNMPAEDFHIVADKVKHVVRNRDPEYHSYHNPQSSVQEAALLLSDLKIEEGMEWSWEMIDSPDGKWGFKARAILNILKSYGPHAKPYVDKIEKDEKLNKMLTGGRWQKMWDGLVKEADKPAKDNLIPFEKAKQP